MEDHSPLSLPALDAALTSVVEQEGVVLVTPQGIRQKMKPRKDRVAELDHTLIRLLAAPRGGTSRDVPIRFERQPRSPYVISLRHITLRQRAKDTRQMRTGLRRTTAAEPLKGAPIFPLESYATETTDLQVQAHPWFAQEQWTPKTFEASYRAVYGRLNRVVSALREAYAICGSWIHRVEEVETQAAHDMERALGVVEIHRFSVARASIAFLGLALLVTLPANAVALYRSVSASQRNAEFLGARTLQTIQEARTAPTLSESAQAFQRASSQFHALDLKLRETNTLALGLAATLSGNYRNAQTLAQIGERASEAARLLARGFEKLFANHNQRFDERLEVLNTYALSAARTLEEAVRIARALSPQELPETQRERARQLRNILEISLSASRELSELSQVLARAVGKDGLRTYLVLFQNHAELRPTGGFIGSFAEVTMDRGELKHIRVPSGGPYDLKQMLLARVAPPAPLTLITNRWQFQDANWSPDFPTSARKLRWFWSHAQQPTIDGVIALNASFLERLLKLTGPIELAEYGKTLTADNVLVETQKAVELEYDKIANTPKKFIGDLLARLTDRLAGLSNEQWLQLAALISEAIDRKDIQLSFVRAEEEALAKRYHWSGRLQETPGDALALIEANIAGQKTDSAITEDVSHRVNIADDGSIQHTVTLTRSHTGRTGDVFRGVRNVSYLRAYVPQGSLLLSASGFQSPPAALFKAADETTQPDTDLVMQHETPHPRYSDVTIAQEDAHTVFGGWMQLDPGKTQTIQLTYRVPKTLAEMNQEYLLLETSQSGRPRHLTTTITVAPRWSLLWSRGLTPAITWNQDRAIALLFAPHAKALAPPRSPSSK